MDIFIIETDEAKNIPTELLKQFKKKDFSDAKKQDEHCFSYLILDRILKEVYGLEERGVAFENNKPFLKSRKKHFSISHSGKYIAICFSDCECGIDIEKIKDRNYNAIAKRMGFICNSLKEFYYAWTKYEAKYKLGTESKSSKIFVYENYVITALSNNISEIFDIYIQNKNNFSNL